LIVGRLLARPARRGENTPVAYYRRLGEVPRKRHTQHRRPDGGLYYEELMGAEGFSSDSSLLYHRRPPSAIIGARPGEPPAPATTANHPLKPRHLRLHALFPPQTWKGADAVTGRRLLLGNGDVRVSYAAAGRASPLYRNALGDECVFVESGQARVETVFGVLDAGPGDYVLLPRGTTHRWVPGGAGPMRAYCIEANSHIRPPRRYLSASGQLLEHAPYCERDLRGPAGPLPVDAAVAADGEAGQTGEPGAAKADAAKTGGDGVDVLVKHAGPGPSGVAATVLAYASHPFDVVGWDGCLYPYAFNVGDFEPVTGRIHQPPPAHQVFEGENFVVCNFVPRKVDYHPLSIPVPYYHSNVDSDEVMFYCGGDYAARAGSGIGLGSVSLHPGGHPHGPAPGAYERSIGTESVDELAVMVDTFRPLGLGEGALACEDPDYAWSWSAGAP
jgi:homogentisate 1,2-dioxygenase